MEFALRRQLTVSLQANEPGRLATISELIAAHGLYIEALCVVDNIDQGVMRLLVDDPGKCKDFLIAAGFSVVEAEVLTIKLTDRRGKLAAITKALAGAHINVDYAYSTVDHLGAHTLLVMKVSNVRMAEAILAKLGDN